MKVAIGTGNGVAVTEHFGYALAFQIWEFADGRFRFLETRRNAPACGAKRDESGSCDPMDVSIELVCDCRAVVVARIGECAVNRLDRLGILAFETEDTVEQALAELAASGLLTERTAA